MIIRFCKKKNKSLIWHRTPNDKKTSSPLLRRKKNIFLWPKLVSQAYFCSDWEYIWSMTVVLRDWHFDFETSPLLDFCQFFEGFGFREFGLGKKKYQFGFRIIWSREKSFGFVVRKFGIGKKVTVSVSVKILVSSFSESHNILKI